MSLLGLGLSLFYAALFVPLEHGVSTVTSINITLGFVLMEGGGGRVGNPYVTWVGLYRYGLR